LLFAFKGRWGLKLTALALRTEKEIKTDKKTYSFTANILAMEN